VDDGDDCGTCPGNWDPSADCDACRTHWVDAGDDCGTCPGNWDPSADCDACLGNWDVTTGCTACRNQWVDVGDDCGTCPGNWDAMSDCSACLGHWDVATGCTVCRNHWVDSGDDCGTCPDNWDPATDCSTCRNHWVDAGDDCGTCPGNWDPTSDCSVCRTHWVDAGDDCGTCPGNWDPSADCDACRTHWVDVGDDCGTCPGNWDASADCDACRNHWVDMGDDCGTCPGNWDASRDCDACLPGWYGSDCELPCIIHVDAAASGGGDGTTWTSAYFDVQDGIDRASYLASTYGTVCDVWVADGTYNVYETDRTDTIQMEADVHVYGGFDKTESTPADRDLTTNESILDGRDAFSGTYHAYHVVTGCADSVLDGFTITEGRADSTGAVEDRIGGGFNGSGTVIRKCKFVDNYAEYAGGAIGTYNSGDSYVIEDSDFINNRSGTTGGAIYCAPGSLVLDLTIDHCTFTTNYSDSGAGITAGGNLTHFDILDSTFTGNWANGTDRLGGAIYVIGPWTAPVMEMVISGTDFDSNQVTAAGGAIYLRYAVSLEITSSTFTSNQVTRGISDGGSQGGAIFCEDLDTLVIDGSTFTSNRSVEEGSAIYLVETGSVTLNESTFNTNTSDEEDPTVVIEGASVAGPAYITSCDFTGNNGHSLNIGARDPASLSGSTFTANKGGAGFGGCTPHVSGCTFSEQTTGASLTISGAPAGSLPTDNLVTNCVFHDNTSASLWLAGMTTAEPKIENCTFVNNDFLGWAPWYGGTVVLVGVYRSKFTNCVFANNRSDMGGVAFTHDNTANSRYVDHSFVDCVFSGNQSTDRDGGAIWAKDNIEIIDSYMVGNMAADHGGAIYTEDSIYLDIINVVFAGNVDASGGSALYDYSDNVNEHWVENCTFLNNTGGIYDYQMDQTHMFVHNTILWNNTTEITPDLAFPYVTYCDIEGDWGTPSHYNIDADPLLTGYPNLVTGTWSGVTYDPTTYQTALQMTGAGWTVGAFEDLLVQPHVLGDQRILHVETNTSDTVYIWGRFDGWINAGDQFRIIDPSLTSSSPCVDAGEGGTGPSEDIVGTTRTSPPDIGAYELP
jgi:predicted outer membrane repeat protein